MNQPAFFRIDEDGRAWLQKQWTELLTKFNAGEKKSDEFFDEIAGKYSEKHRAYHNLSHIHALLNLIRLYQEKIHDYQAVCFAIWFHDVIYDTKRNDNEEKSAEYAGQVLDELGVSAEIRNPVRNLILATRHHAAETLSPDGRFFLDADLSILGASEEIYRKYSQAIREEYSWVIGFIYRRTRKKILKNFLTRERIYLTHEMAEKLETQARHNVKAEIQSL